MNPPATITDGVVALRKLREGDRADVVAAFNDDLVRRWLNMPAHPSDADFDSVMRTMRNGFVSGERYDYAVTEVPYD